MAGDESSKFASVCFITSFLWLLHSLDRHSLIDQPRLSAFLVLLVSGGVAFALSFVSKQLPGADGRFDSEAVFKDIKSSLPQRPRKHYIPSIVVLIVIRLEILCRVVYDLQCTVQGVEAFLPFILAGYQFFFERKQATVPNPGELEDPWGSVWDDFIEWLNKAQIPVLFVTLLLSYGVFLGADFVPKSSYFCSTRSDGALLVIFLQWAGVFLDAAIIVLIWRVLSWTKTTKSRLQKLGSILAMSSLATGVLWLFAGVSQSSSTLTGSHFLGLNTIFAFDVFSNGIACAVAAISATLWICEAAPLPLAGTATFICGTISAFHEILLFGTYQQTSRLLPLIVLQLITTSFSVFTYTASMRSVLYIPRVLLILMALTLLAIGTITAIIKKPMVSRHPVEELIYRNRVEADRWLRHATVSTTLHLAVSEYKERHQGRNPPANFDKWFEFASERNSVIVDKFDQMETDILPFWGMKPSKIKEGLDIARALPDVGVITVAGGKASHIEREDLSQDMMLDESINMIEKFAQFLPDMEIAINLRERPRVLVPWDDAHRLTEKGSKPISKLEKVLPQALTRRQAENDGAIREVTPVERQVSQNPATHVAAQDFRYLQALACPPGSKTRAGVTWNFRDHCASCSDPHSQGQILRDWEHSLDPCHQPDIFNLHDFHTTPHQFDLHQDLLPVFSRSKTSSFNDILMPLVRLDEDEKVDETRFDAKENRLFWQEYPQDQPATHESVHGGHRNRLVHLLNNATAFDKRSMLLGVKVGKETMYAYEQIGTREVNNLLSTDISYALPTTKRCENANCQLALHESFAFKTAAGKATATNRYIMLLDTSDGPSSDTLPVLRSNGVPFISTIFREWYTERLMPWTHFVPIDIRYHGLHSTLAYFEGLKGRGKINGREQVMEESKADARWIAEQGRKWAEKAIRKEDMEVYLFRLLLEWGRVISEDRDSIGFVLKEGT
ncbi:capsular associated protein [Truncatella angustata]|uniref:Capsular associated protein n=1 Tax=Truncatella angustata TaxID=152316 RepID=A0A9P8UTB8_9PEZI|nr:capsular associated protein [Truncatella angustata]KAH6657863.1 capsular associated protein [Truncatella angustata]